MVDYQGESNDATQEDDSIFLPFTRADGCKILEPLNPYKISKFHIAKPNFPAVQ